MSTAESAGDGEGGGETMDQSAIPPTQPQPSSQHPPPSPLSGSYLIVVLPEPRTARDKDLILNRLAKGFLSWDKDTCHVDLEKELQAFVAQAPEGEEARNGERLIQFATENLVTEVLIHPQTNTLFQCIRNLLASFTKHRHIIHAGYTFGGNGSWILQDGTFSLADFLDTFSEHEVQRVLRAYENSVTVDIHCAGAGDWSTSRLSKESCTSKCNRVRVNPDDVLTAGVPAVTSFTEYIEQFLIPQTLDQLMEPSDVVGNIRFSHPTLYVFPGGQGDAALFGINGFNMLVDGGFARKACFWDFTRHLDRLDAVLVTRFNNCNAGGISSILTKKKETNVYPQIGHFFCNLVERKHTNSPDGDKDLDPLVVDLIDIGQEMMTNLRCLNLRAHPCYRQADPINLYHKVGHGTLDMYVLSPNKDSREVREFLAKWNASDSKLFASSHRKDSNKVTFPVQNLVSICALLVWQPANPEDTITRILFPGSTPQHKVFEGFDHLKKLEFLKHPVCSTKSLSPSASLSTLKEKTTKKFELKKRDKIKDPIDSKYMKSSDEPNAKPVPPISSRSVKAESKSRVENKRIIESETKKVEKEMKKGTKKLDETKKTEVNKEETEKTVKIKPAESKKKEIKESKVILKTSKPESKSKPVASISVSDKKRSDKKESSPTTPKKTLNIVSTKSETTKASESTKVTKSAVHKISKTPIAPAKSTKDANNRKVLEQKKQEMSTMTNKTTSTAATKSALKAKPSSEKKPVVRKTKQSSPSKVRISGSPAKSTRSTPTTSVKSDKDGVIRRVKGDKSTADSSTVSTPSGVEAELAAKHITEKSEDISLDSIESKVLADLKEEREAAEEIEAVLQKAERNEAMRKDLEGEDEVTAEATDKKEEDMTEEDVTADIEDVPKKELSRKESQELTEEDEYLIVEAEESMQSEDAEQKNRLDEAESEKIRIHEGDEKQDETPEKISSVQKETVDSETIKGDLEERRFESLKEEQTIEDKEELTKINEEIQETSTSSPDKLDPDKKMIDDNVKVDKESVFEKQEESQERISTIESGGSTTAPTLPTDERIPLDEIKEDIDEKHVIEDVKEKDVPTKVVETEITAQSTTKPEVKVINVSTNIHGVHRDIVKTPDEVADLPVHEEVDPKFYQMDEFTKEKEDITKEDKEKEDDMEKEHKEVLGFFEKVADKFEKTMDKTTHKQRKESGTDEMMKHDEEKHAKSDERSTTQAMTDMVKDSPVIAKPDTDTLVCSKEDSKDAPQKDILEDRESVKQHKIDDEKFVAEESIEKVQDVVSRRMSVTDEIKGKTKDDVEEPLEKSITKDMPDEVADKVEQIEEMSFDAKETEKMKLDIPDKQDIVEDIQEEFISPLRNLKDAVRDVGEVLAGTAGIAIEEKEKPKNVEEIVKKVAEVLREDDLLLELALSMKGKETAVKEENVVEQILPKKVGITEELPSEEEIEEMLETCPAHPLTVFEKSEEPKEVHEELHIKQEKRTVDSSTEKMRKDSLLEMSSDLLETEIDRTKRSTTDNTATGIDVMISGEEPICEKVILVKEDRVEVPVIGFEQKLTPGKAELVVVTPGSTPSTPKFAEDIGQIDTDIQIILDKNIDLEEILKIIILDKKQKITLQIIDYIFIIKGISKKMVIYTIEKFIIEHNLLRQDVVDDVTILRTQNIDVNQRLALEEYLKNEYIDKNRKLNSLIIEEISILKIVPKRVLCEILEEIMVQRNLPRSLILDISNAEYLKTCFDSPEIEDRTFSTKTPKSSPVEETKYDKKKDTYIAEVDDLVKSSFIQKETDDFEVVEQEYKVQGNVSRKLSEVLEKDIEETLEQDTGDVTEATEESIPQVSPTKPLDEGIKSVTGITDKNIEAIQDISTFDKPDEDSQIVKSSDDTVRRMVVTASSEDGGHEMEICAAGSITFTKSISPDDSLKEEEKSSRSTQDKDSLQEDKDSLISTPEKDSSSLGALKEARKVSLNDSLEKSPSDIKHPESEDSLEIDKVQKETVDSKIQEERQASPVKGEISPIKEIKGPTESMGSLGETTSDNLLESTGKEATKETEAGKIDEGVIKKSSRSDSVASTEKAADIESDIAEKDNKLMSKSRSPSSVGTGKSEAIQGIERSVSPDKIVQEKSRSASVVSIEKEGEVQSMDTSLSPDKTIQEKSRSASIVSTGKEGEVQIMDTSLSPEKTVQEKSRSASIVSIGNDEKPQSMETSISPEKTVQEKSRSASIVSIGKREEVQSIDTSLSPEKTVQEKSRSASIVSTGKEGEVQGMDTSISPEKTVQEKSRSASIVSIGKEGEVQSIDTSLSPEKTVQEKSRSASIISIGKEGEVQSIDTSLSPEKAVQEKSRSASVVSTGKEGEVQSIDTSLSPEKTVQEKSRSASIVSIGKEGEVQSIDTSLSPEKAVQEKSRSASVVSTGKEGEVQSMDTSISPEKTVQEKSRSASVVSIGKEGEVQSMDTSNSPEKIVQEKSRSASIVSIGKEEAPLSMKTSESPEKTIQKTSRSASVVSTGTKEIFQSEDAGIFDGKIVLKTSRSASIVSAEKEDIIQGLETNKSPEKVSEEELKSDSFASLDKELIDGSKEKSKVSTESVHKTSRSGSIASTVAGEVGESENLVEVDDKSVLKSSRSASVASTEKEMVIDPHEQCIIDAKAIQKSSRSESIVSTATEHIDEMKVDVDDETQPKSSRSESLVGTEKQELAQSVETSKSPEITIQEKSRSASIVSTGKEAINKSADHSELDVKAALKSSRSASIASTITEEDVERKDGDNLDAETIPMSSRSASVVNTGDGLISSRLVESEIEAENLQKTSRSGSNASVETGGINVPSKTDDKTIQKSSSSTSIGKQEIEESMDKPEEKSMQDKSRSASFVSTGPEEIIKSISSGENEDNTSHNKSGSASVISREKEKIISSIVREGNETKIQKSSTSSSVASTEEDNVQDRDTAKIEDKVMQSKSRSASIVSTAEKTISESVDALKADSAHKELRSLSLESTAVDLTDASGATEKSTQKIESSSASEKESTKIESLVTGDDKSTESKQSIKAVDEKFKSRSGSIISLEKNLDSELEYDDKIQKILVEKLRSTSIVSDVESIDRTKSPSSDSDKFDLRGSKSPSIIDEKIEHDDVEHEKKETFEVSEESTGSLIKEEKDVTKTSLTDYEQDLTAKLQTLSEHQELKSLLEPDTMTSESNIQTETKTPKDRSRSHSVFETAEKTSLGRSRTASLYEEKLGLSDSMRISSSDEKQSELKSSPTKELEEETEEDLSKIPVTKKIELEKYITNEYVAKNIKINSKSVDEIAKLMSVSKYIVISIIEGIIIDKKLRRGTIYEPDGDPKSDHPDSLGQSSKINTQDLKPSSSSDSDAKDWRKSPSPDFDRSEPHIDEEVTLSEDKRNEIENFILDNYVSKRKKITELDMGTISIRTALPKYILCEIIEEIIIKKKARRESIADNSIFHDTDVEDSLEKSPVHLFHDDDRSKFKSDRSTPEQKSSGFSTPDQHVEKSSYPVDYETQFHKAFVGGMTEIRTTHITTLSGKSTPDAGRNEGTPDSELISAATEESDKTDKKVLSKTSEEIGTVETTVILKTTQITGYSDDESDVHMLPSSQPVDATKYVEGKTSDTVPQDSTSTAAITTISTSKTSVSYGSDKPVDVGEKVDETVTESTAINEGIDAKELIEKLTAGVSGKSTPDLVSKELLETGTVEHLEYSVSPVIRDLISEDRTYSGKSSPDISLPKDIVYSEPTGKSTPDVSMSPLIRDGAMMQSYISGRSTPDRRSEGRSKTATPDSFRSGEVMRTIITTTRTMSEDGDIITTTKEVTETTNEKGETVILAEKTDVKVDDRVGHESLPDDASHAAEFSSAEMSSSFYGELPTRPADVKVEATAGSSQEDYSFRQFTQKKESKKYVDDTDLDFDKVMSQEAHSQETKLESEEGPSSDPMMSSFIAPKETEDLEKKDPLAGWDSPLGLPSPKPPRKFNLRCSQNSQSSSADLTPDSLNFDMVSDWGEPLRLPSPAAGTGEVSNNALSGTPQKEKKAARKVITENIKNKKLSESPVKNDKKLKDMRNKLQPVYMDLTYVPHNGNSFYTALEFFKKIRARYYVFSGTEPSREVYDALLEAKKTWEDKDLEVTIIPTYDTDTLGYWVADNEEALTANHIDLSPSASRCTINLQDHETSCSAYRLEF